MSRWSPRSAYGHATLGDGRQPPSLSASAGRQPLVADRASDVPAPIGQDALDQAGHGDDVPLQALGGVHGEHLHGDPADVDVAGRPSVGRTSMSSARPDPAPGRARAPRPPRARPGTPRASGRRRWPRSRPPPRPARPGGPARGRGAHPGPGGDLDVQQQGALDLDDELGQRQRRAGAQPRAAGSPAGSAARGRPADSARPDGVAPARPRQRVQRLDDAGLVDDVRHRLDVVGRAGRR